MIELSEFTDLYSDFLKLSFLNPLDKYWQMRKAIFLNDISQYLLDYPSIRFVYVNQGYQAIYGHLPSVICIYKLSLFSV